MPLLNHTATDEARGVLTAASGLELLPLFATAEMRAHVDLRALTNLHMGRLSGNIGLASEYAILLKAMDDALLAADATHTLIMPQVAITYVPIIMDVVQDAIALYASKVPMGTAAGVPGASTAELAKALKDASAASAVEHMKECEQSYETDRHAAVSGVACARVRRGARPFTPHCSHLMVHTWVFTPDFHCPGARYLQRVDQRGRGRQPLGPVQGTALHGR